MEYVLSLDCGITMTKAVIFSSDGKEQGIGFSKPPVIYPKPGWVEKDPLELWKNAAQAIKGALGNSGIDPKKIACITATAHGSGIFCLDKNCEPTRNGIISTDRRAAQTVDKLIEEGVFEKTFPITGVQIWTGSAPVLMRWIKENEPDVYKKTRYICLAKDYLKYMLCGELTTDYTDATASALLDTWNYRHNPEIFEYFGVKEVEGMIPPVLDSWVIAGKVSKEGAEQTGLMEGTPVAEGGVDYCMTTLGAGCIEPQQLCFIVGTWSINSLIIDHRVTAPEVLMSQSYSAPKLWILMDGSPSSATNLDWFVEQFCHWEVLEGKKRDVSPFEVVNEEIKDMGPESCDIIFHPFLYGSNVQASARAGFYGLGGWHTRADLLRAVMEGVCFSHRTHISKLEAAEPIKEAFIGGGGKRSEIWTAMFSDILNVPVTVPKSNELGALGCAVTSAVAAGIYPDLHAAIEKMCTVERKQDPAPEAHEIYEKKYEIYKMLTESMTSPWDAMYDEAQMRRI